MTESALSFSKLAVTRIIHDLAGAVGAVSNSLELLSEIGGADKETLSLAESSAQILVARLGFFRAAYGSEGPLNSSDMTRQLVENYLHSLENRSVRFSCVWQVDSEMPMFIFRLILLSVQIVAESMIRGGNLSVKAKAGEKRLHIHAESEKILFDKSISEILNGHKTELTPKQVAAVFILFVLQEQGWAVSATHDEKSIDFILAVKE